MAMAGLGMVWGKRMKLRDALREIILANGFALKVCGPMYNYSNEKILYLYQFYHVDLELFWRGLG